MSVFDDRSRNAPPYATRRAIAFDDLNNPGRELRGRHSDCEGALPLSDMQQVGPTVGTARVRILTGAWFSTCGSTVRMSHDLADQRIPDRSSPDSKVQFAQDPLDPQVRTWRTMTMTS